MLSNLRADGSLWPHKSNHGLFLAGNRGWHTDSSCKRVPAIASILAAHQVPDCGARTESANMGDAWQSLDPKTHALLEDKIAVHSYLYSQGLVGGLSVLRVEEQAALPLVQHSVIRPHPKTGQKSLYIRRHASHIKGENVLKKAALFRTISKRSLPTTSCHST